MLPGTLEVSISLSVPLSRPLSVWCFCDPLAMLGQTVRFFFQQNVRMVSFAFGVNLSSRAKHGAFYCDKSPVCVLFAVFGSV